MDYSVTEVSSHIYCPNKSCSAYNGLKRPLIELPIDPNHAQLFCPFCDTNVVQCDGCYSLIITEPTSTVPVPITTCRKCSMPNVRDENLRQLLGLPRTNILPYDSIRTLQRSISASLYANYKNMELKRVNSATEETEDEFEVIGSLEESVTTSGSVWAPIPSNKDIFEINSDEKANENHKVLNSKKRARESDMNGDAEMDSIPSVDGTGSRKKVVDFEIKRSHADISHINSSMVVDRSSAEIILRFGRWRSRLNVPLPFILTALRTQVKTIDSSMAKTHDAKAWSAMLWPQRANRFLSVHAVLLRSLYARESDFHERHVLGGLDDDFFSRLDRFLQKRSTLLSSKVSVRSPLQVVVDWLRTPRSVLQAEQAGVTPAIFKTISKLVESKYDDGSASNRSEIAGFLPILQSVSNELRNLFASLLSLNHRLTSQDTAYSADPGPLSTSSGQKGESSESTELEMPKSHISSENASSRCQVLDLVEHSKFAVLLLMNLHSSLSAVLL